MKISNEWLKKYQKIKELLVSPINFNELFKKDKIDGKNLFKLNIGTIFFSENKVLVRDPLVWLNKNEQPYIFEVPKGEFYLETLVVELNEDVYKYIATRVVLNENVPIIYHQALKGDENLDDVNSDSYFGFNVDSGLATIVDIKTRDVFCDFVDNWNRENLNKDIYTDYLANEFKNNAIENPKFQSVQGDWINFRIPDTNIYVPMIQTGYGDGQYPVYFGYDEKGNLCDVVMEYIFLGGYLEEL